MYKECLNLKCNKTYYAERNKTKYCSQHCYHQHFSWNRGKKLTEIHKQRIKEAQQGEKAYWYGKSLSLETRNKISEAMKGDKTHLWKGGITKKYHRGIKYRKWRRTVFIRDEFTCRECNKKHTYITAHHIKSWNDYPKLRYSVNNGKTLCEDCHKKTDNYKGRPKKRIKQ